MPAVLGQRACLRGGRWSRTRARQSRHRTITPVLGARPSGRPHSRYLVQPQSAAGCKALRYHAHRSHSVLLIQPCPPQRASLRTGSDTRRVVGGGRGPLAMDDGMGQHSLTDPEPACCVSGQRSAAAPSRVAGPDLTMYTVGRQ